MTTLADDGNWQAVLDGEFMEFSTQDIKDGAALRRLREALPDDGDMSVSVESGFEVEAEASWPVPDSEPDGEYWWREDGQRMDSAYGTGATIAEAADKCREALG